MASGGDSGTSGLKMWDKVTDEDLAALRFTLKEGRRGPGGGGAAMGKTVFVDVLKYQTPKMTVPFGVQYPMERKSEFQKRNLEMRCPEVELANPKTGAPTYRAFLNKVDQRVIAEATAKKAEWFGNPRVKDLDKSFRWSAPESFDGKTGQERAPLHRAKVAWYPRFLFAGRVRIAGYIDPTTNKINPEPEFRSKCGKVFNSDPLDSKETSFTRQFGDVVSDMVPLKDARTGTVLREAETGGVVMRYLGPDDVREWDDVQVAVCLRNIYFQKKQDFGCVWIADTIHVLPNEDRAGSSGGGDAGRKRPRMHAEDGSEIRYGRVTDAAAVDGVDLDGSAGAAGGAGGAAAPVDESVVAAAGLDEF